MTTPEPTPSVSEPTPTTPSEPTPASSKEVTLYPGSFLFREVNVLDYHITSTGCKVPADKANEILAAAAVSGIALVIGK